MTDNLLKLRLTMTSVICIGIYVVGFGYPVVPIGTARIRVQISTAHRMEDIDHAVEAFIEVGKKHGVI